jgi:IS5 family transposase
VLGQVAEDLRRRDLKETGRQGLTAEAVLRCALLKQYRQLSYQELARLSCRAPFLEGARDKRFIVMPPLAFAKPCSWGILTACHTMD